MELNVWATVISLYLRAHEGGLPHDHNSKTVINLYIKKTTINVNNLAQSVIIIISILT